MTKALTLLKSLLGEDFNYSRNPIPEPVGTNVSPNASLIPNPNDAKNFGKNNSMDIEDSAPLATKIGNIIDSLDDSDITDELADIVESFLDQVDPDGTMSVEQAALMLPLEDCQDLYEELTSYLKKNNIDYSEDSSFDTSGDNMGIGNIPVDLYPTGSGLISGGNSDVPSTMTW